MFFSKSNSENTALKFVNIWRSYRQNYVVSVFYGSRCIKSASVKDWCKSAHGVAGRADPSARNEEIGKCRLAGPVTLLNFIAVKRCTRKALQFFLHTSVFWHHRGGPCARVHQYVWCVQKGLLYQAVEFRPLYEVSATKVRWFRGRRDPQTHTHTQQTVNDIVSALPCGD